jgi:hypothetical protein
MVDPRTMADLNLDQPERPERTPELGRYAVIDRWNGAIVATHNDEEGAEREVITTGNLRLVVLASSRLPRPRHPWSRAVGHRSPPCTGMVVVVTLAADRVEREAGSCVPGVRRGDPDLPDRGLLA